MADVMSEQITAVKALLHDVFHGMRYQIGFLFGQHTGITPSQLAVLQVIAGHTKEPPTFTAVVRELNLAPSTVSGIVKRLERDGLVKRLQEPADLRVSRLQLTGRAAQLLGTLCKVYDYCIDQNLKVFTQDELESFVELLAKLKMAIELADLANLDDIVARKGSRIE
ncbi:MAG: MarR family winged helix-turn-helix transcriptional regulator, partial [Limnochordia bacterium]